MASASLTSRASNASGSARNSATKFWPAIAVVPILIAGPLKAAGETALGGIDLTVLGVALILCTALISFLRYPTYPVRLMLPFLVLSAVVLIEVSRSLPGDYQGVKARDFFLLTGVVVWCLPLLLRSTRDLRGFVIAWYLAGTTVACLVLFIGAAQDLQGRAAIGEATLGPAYLSAAALVAGAAALGEKILSPFVALPGIVCSGIALVTIASRGPLLGAAAGVIVWILLRGVFRGRTIVVLLLVAGVAALGVQRASQTALTRLVLDDPARQELWGIARRAFLQAPYLGLGWGNYSAVSWADYPHNLVMESSAEMGLLGLLAVLGLLLVAAKRVWDARRLSEARVLGGLATVMLVGQQFSADLTNRDFWIALSPCLLLPLLVFRSGSAHPGTPEPIKLS